MRDMVTVMECGKYRAGKAGKGKRGTLERVRDAACPISTG